MKTFSKALKEKGNLKFKRKNFEEAEKFYSEAIELNKGSRPLWTNRAICRNSMKKHEEAISDCESALSLNPKCTKSLVQKGNALIGLGLFDEAKICYESLRPLGEGALADSYLKKVHDAQERAEIFEQKLEHNDFRNFSTLIKSFQHQCHLRAQKRNKIKKYHRKVKSKSLIPLLLLIHCTRNTDNKLKKMTRLQYL